MNQQVQDRPITGNGDGQFATSAPPLSVEDDLWSCYVRAQRARDRQRIERQLRLVARRLVAAEYVRLGDHEAIQVSHIVCSGITPFVRAAVEQFQATRRFEQLELGL